MNDSSTMKIRNSAIYISTTMFFMEIKHQKERQLVKDSNKFELNIIQCSVIGVKKEFIEKCIDGDRSM